MFVALEIRRLSSFGEMCKLRELVSSLCPVESVSVRCESEWYCSLLLSAMYAGLFMTLNEGHFFCCEGRPCTAPLPVWFVFGLLVFKLNVICESIWCWDFWTRLENKFFRIRRVYRWTSSIEQAMTLLRVAKPKVACATIGSRLAKLQPCKRSAVKQTLWIPADVSARRA